MSGINFRSENGSFLTAIVGIILVLGVIGFILARMTISSQQLQHVEIEEQRALYAAESGLQFGIKKYLSDDDVANWEEKSLNAGDGLSVNVSLEKIAGNKVRITAVGNTGNTTKTVETVISDNNRNYVPDYAVYSNKTVNDITTKDSTGGNHDTDLIFQNAPAVPRFDFDKLRSLSKQADDQGNAYYYNGDLTVTNDFNPPDGAVVFVEGKLKFDSGNWPGDVHFVAMDDISFKPSFRKSPGLSMTIYQGNPDKKVWIEPRNYDDDPIEFKVDGGEVVPSEPYAASIEVIGCALPFGFFWSAYDAPITLNIRIGNDDIYPFGPNPNPGYTQYSSTISKGNVNQGSFPKRVVLPNTYPAGTSISIKATSWKVANFWWTKYVANLSVNSLDANDGSTVIKAYRDGDTPPDVDGYGNQKSAEEFIRDYIDFDKNKVTLDDNQAIYLVELATRDLSSPSADFQDLVLLISLAKDKSDLGGGGGGGGEVDTENLISFKGGIISNARVYGSSVDTDEEKGLEITNTLEVVRDEQLIKDFLSYSVNGNARVLFDTKWKRKN